MKTVSVLWRLEGLACDWSENNEHSRQILSVHGFRSLTVTDCVFVLCNFWMSSDLGYIPIIHNG